MAHLLGFLDLVKAGSIDVFGLQSLFDKLCSHQSWLAAVCATVHLNNGKQSLEVLHIIHVYCVMSLIVWRYLIFSLLKSPRALLIVVKASAVSAYDEK